jgi:hypothetical protein
LSRFADLQLLWQFAKRLQEIHGLRFDYASNHLRYEIGPEDSGKAEVWRIEAGRPNPECDCGTGTCKREIISRYRERHPGSFCVHIGNGRVSDLCGALAADLAFAKETLAEALRERAYPYRDFESLLDVIEGLTKVTEPLT